MELGPTLVNQWESVLPINHDLIPSTQGGPLFKSSCQNHSLHLFFLESCWCQIGFMFQSADILTPPILMVNTFSYSLRPMDPHLYRCRISIDAGANQELDLQLIYDQMQLEYFYIHARGHSHVFK